MAKRLASEPERLEFSCTTMGATDQKQIRLRYAALAVGTIIVGLLVHRVDVGLNPVARDMLGDALWAMMMFYWLGVLIPRARRWTRAGWALAICFGVEASQLYHRPWLDAIRATLPGHLILGQGFDARDLLSYSLGIGMAVGAASVFSSRR